MCLWGRGSPPAHHSPSSFFSPPLLAATEPYSPPASPPLACRTPCSTLDPALANRMGMSGLQWGDGGGRGGPCPCSSGFYLCRHNKRGRRENEKKASAPLLPVHLLRSPALSLLLRAIYEQLLLSLPAPLSVPSEAESEDAQEGKMSMDQCSGT